MNDGMRQRRRPQTVAQYNKINPRACPGSYSKAKVFTNGKAVCPFCFLDWPVRDNGTIKGHARRK